MSQKDLTIQKVRFLIEKS